MKNKKIIQLCRDLNAEILTDGFTNTNQVKFESLLSTMVGLKDFETLFNTDFILLLFLVEGLKCDLSPLAKINLVQYKMKVIDLAINWIQSVEEEEEEENTKEEENSCDITSSCCDKISSAPKLKPFEVDFFEMVDGKKYIKDKSKLPEDKSLHFMMMLYSDNGTIKHTYRMAGNGEVLEQESEPVIKPEDIDYDEIYAQLASEVLQYRDGSAQL